jgi:hypothetical protein
MSTTLRTLCVPALLLCAAPAMAQRIPFERSFDTHGPVRLDVSTLAGRITVTASAADRVVVRGTATVRVAFNVPADAAELARQIAATPPIDMTGDVLRLRPPASDRERRAATVAYEVVVPPGTRVTATSDSGAVSVTGVSAPVVIRTSSAAITASGLGSTLEIESGSGAVSVAGVTGTLAVTTQSSAIGVQDARSATRIRSGSGALSLAMAQTADLDVETASSAIRITGAAQALRVATGSGRIDVTGQPHGDWQLSTRSGQIHLHLAGASDARFDITTRSGGITVPEELAARTVEKRHVEGSLGQGRAAVTVRSGSGAVAVRLRP